MKFLFVVLIIVLCMSFIFTDDTTETYADVQFQNIIVAPPNCPEGYIAFKGRCLPLL